MCGGKEGQKSLTGRSSVCVCSVTKSYPTLHKNMGSSLPVSSGHWISQARTLEWVAISFSRDLPAHLLHWQVNSLPRRCPEKPLEEPPEHFKCTVFVCCPKMVDVTFTYLQHVVPSKSAGTQALLLCNTKPGENPKSLFRIFQ